jgi:hypothetical protein
MKVIAYYTLSYKEQAKRLVSSLMKYSLDFYVKIYEDRETWAQNCQIKPEFILECLETFDEDLLFVDADAEFVRQPPMDYLSGENLGVYILAWRNPDNPEHLEQELISATIWIPNNPQNKRLIKKWVDQCKEHPTKWDQTNFQDVVRKQKGVELSLFQPEWNYIEKYHSELNIDPIIIQHQASNDWTIDREQWLPLVKEQLGDVDIAVELGVWRGHYSRSIINTLIPKTFYGVDPYELYEGYSDKPGGMSNPEFNSQKNMDNLHNKTLAKYENFNDSYRRTKSILVRDFGDAYAQQFEDNSVDFVYLDADHTYESVKAEIKAWWPKVKIGGILSGHDYFDKTYFGVIPAVNEFVEREQLELKTTDEKFKSWWVVKNQLELF